MSQFYDQASLVMVPSGYKAGKVYSQKPLSTDGELTFTRNSNATRVNADGLVEKVRTNVLLYSNTFSNAAWTVYSGSPTLTLVNNNATAPDGTQTASTLNYTVIGGGQQFFQNVSLPAGTYNTSIYLRSATGSSLSMTFGFYDGSNKNENITVGTTWQRFDVSKTLVNTTVRCCWLMANELNASVEIWNAQTEVSDFGPTEYIPTTSAAVSVGPTANVPRIDYTGGGCGKLILEPQRTNVHLLSESMYEMPRFALSGAVSPTNARSLSTVSPSGYYNATELTGGNSSTGSWGIYNLIPTSISAGNQVSVSTFAKAGTHDKIFLSQANISYTGTNGAYFDLSNGTTPTAGARMEYYGNGWWRCFMPVVTLTANSPSSYNIGHYVAPSTSSNVWSTNYNGKSVYFFGTQVEAGSYATSYIPTLGASVTRLADAAYKTGISSLIGQTEGTLFADIIQNGGAANTSYIMAWDGTYSNRIAIYSGGLGNESKIAFYVTVGGVNTVIFTTSAVYLGRHKIALAYKLNDVVAYIDGVEVLNDTSATIPATTALALPTSANAANGTINQTLLFKTRLTNQQLSEITAL